MGDSEVEHVEVGGFVGQEQEEDPAAREVADVERVHRHRRQDAAPGNPLVLDTPQPPCQMKTASHGSNQSDRFPLKDSPAASEDCVLTLPKMLTVKSQTFRDIFSKRRSCVIEQEHFLLGENPCLCPSGRVLRLQM